ncbi:methyltransferase domain-containing protein [Phaeodactylibacter sp.]|uniref:methyltransferase domain-containing protein n=1 Tax=Phaeodactylibacter sp. TaxID=1940289 RepID=UPI0025D40521|nr:methyltransferase domain-containing protein [Phaeodactylibacter sp.]MCI4650495.1 methyltransferase domain-containing protein [Phaeodactylibacter sp.]MCI5091665.1 methyltransferase domain-containing protein [Phaeodactylibacter sp.]
MPTSPLQTSHFRDIIRYYDETRFDYQVAWLNEDNQAVHFGFYDRNHRTHDQALLNTNQIMAARSRVEPGEHVLDAGCGNGGSSLWLAAQKSVRVTGITPVATQVATAEKQASERKLTHLCRFFEGNYCQVPLEDSSLDVIWACESLCHAEDKAAFYREAARLLKPGGRIVIAEYIRYLRPLPSAQETLLLDWVNRWAIPDLDTAEEHRVHLENTSFENIQIEDFTRYAFISLKNLYLISRRWLWANYLLYPLGVRTRAQHNNIVGSVRQFQALRRGLWYYGLITAQKPFGSH